MKSLLSFGEALIDFHARTPSDGSTPPTFQPHAGGAPANVAVAVSRLGGHAGFVGMIGRDMFGDMLLAQLDEAGVDTSSVARTNAANTALAFVSHDAFGERSFSFYRPPSADLLFREAHFDRTPWAQARLFHACSNSLTETPIAETTLTGMQRAHAAGALRSFDMNLRPALWAADTDPLPRLWSALEHADIIKLSTEEMQVLSNASASEHAARQRLWQGSARLLVITHGARPVHWYTREAHGTVPTFAMPAVDTTGAGDAFTGGLLHGLDQADASPRTLDSLLNNQPRLERILRFACACGALAVTRTGSFEAMPTLAAVQTFMDEQAGT